MILSPVFSYQISDFYEFVFKTHANGYLYEHLGVKKKRKKNGEHFKSK